MQFFRFRYLDTTASEICAADMRVLFLDVNLEINEAFC